MGTYRGLSAHEWTVVDAEPVAVAAPAIVSIGVPVRPPSSNDHD